MRDQRTVITKAVTTRIQEPTTDMGHTNANKTIYFGVFVLFYTLLLCGRLYGQFPEPPEILGRSYFIQDLLGIEERINFRLERGNLVVNRELATGKLNSFSLRFSQLVSISVPTPLPHGMWTVFIQTNDIGYQFIPFNKKDEAISVAKYLSAVTGVRFGENNPAPLASQTESLWADIPAAKPLWDSKLCPSGAGMSCASFKDLADHNDPDIVRYLSSDDTSRKTACFSTGGGDRFFVIEISNLSNKLRRGMATFSQFENGVQKDYDLYSLIYVPNSYSRIQTMGKSPLTAGSVTEAELDLNKSFTNKMGTETQYKLSLRWATGKYLEEYYAPDEKKKITSMSDSGYCVALN